MRAGGDVTWPISFGVYSQCTVHVHYKPTLHVLIKRMQQGLPWSSLSYGFVCDFSRGLCTVLARLACRKVR